MSSDRIDRRRRRRPLNWPALIEAGRRRYRRDHITGPPTNAGPQVRDGEREDDESAGSSSAVKSAERSSLASIRLAGD